MRKITQIEAKGMKIRKPGKLAYSHLKWKDHDFPSNWAAEKILSVIKSRKIIFVRDPDRIILISSLGLNSSASSKRQNLLILARLVPLVERFTNLIELVPRETGESYI